MINLRQISAYIAVLVLAISAVGIVGQAKTFCADPVSLDFGDNPAITQLEFTIRNCGTSASDFVLTTKSSDPYQRFIVDVSPSVITALPPGASRTVAVEITRRGFEPGNYINLLHIYTDSYTDCEYGCTYEVHMTVPGTCTWKDITPKSRSFPPGGGQGSVTVTTDSGCPAWSPVPHKGWIHIIMFNESAGVFSYLVDPNTGATSRVGTITAAGLTHTVTQEGSAACSYSIFPTYKSYSAAGGTGSVTVSAQEGCLWKATTDVDWITFMTQPYWVGSSTLAYSVAKNTGEARTGTIYIAGQKHVVSQAAYENNYCSNDKEAPNFSIQIVSKECDCTKPSTAACSVELRWPTQDNCSPSTKVLHRYRLDNEEWSRWLTNTTHYAARGLSKGEHIFWVEAKDAAGNIRRKHLTFSLGCQNTSSSPVPSPLPGDGEVAPQNGHASGGERLNKEFIELFSIIPPDTSKMPSEQAAQVLTLISEAVEEAHAGLISQAAETIKRLVKIAGPLDVISANALTTVSHSAHTCSYLSVLLEEIAKQTGYDELRTFAKELKDKAEKIGNAVDLVTDVVAAYMLSERLRNAHSLYERAKIMEDGGTKLLVGTLNHSVGVVTNLLGASAFESIPVLAVMGEGSIIMQLGLGIALKEGEYMSRQMGCVGALADPTPPWPQRSPCFLNECLYGDRPACSYVKPYTEWNFVWRSFLGEQRLTCLVHPFAEIENGDTLAVYVDFVGMGQNSVQVTSHLQLLYTSGQVSSSFSTVKLADGIQQIAWHIPWRAIYMIPKSIRINLTVTDAPTNFYPKTMNVELAFPVKGWR